MTGRELWLLCNNNLFTVRFLCNNKRMARPKKKPANRRGHTLAIRLTKSEYELLEGAGDAKGAPSISDWARETLLRSARKTKGAR